MTLEVEAEPRHRAGGRRSWRSLVVPALLAFAFLIGLGIWQIQRKTWKEGLIAALSARLATPPQPLPATGTWSSLDPEQEEYRRVTFSAVFDNSREALVFAAAAGFRPDVSGTGYWVFTPARLGDGSIVIVNRGFVPDSRQNPQSRPDGEVAGPVEITGAMRWPDQRHWFTPNDDPVHNMWFSRDPAAIAAAKGLGEGAKQGANQGANAVAPFYVEQEAPSPPGGLPQPGRLVVSLPDNHLQYAVTWFGLAAVLAAVFLSWAFTSGGPDPAGADGTQGR